MTEGIGAGDQQALHVFGNLKMQSEFVDGMEMAEFAALVEL